MARFVLFLLALLLIVPDELLTRAEPAASDELHLQMAHAAPGGLCGQDCDGQLDLDELLFEPNRPPRPPLRSNVVHSAPTVPIVQSLPDLLFRPPRV